MLLSTTACTWSMTIELSLSLRLHSVGAVTRAFWCESASVLSCSNISLCACHWFCCAVLTEHMKWKPIGNQAEKVRQSPASCPCGLSSAPCIRKIPQGAQHKQAPSQ